MCVRSRCPSESNRPRSGVCPGLRQRHERRARTRRGRTRDGDLQERTKRRESRRADAPDALVQAQEQLKLSDDKYPAFLVKFKALQDVRRRALQERNRALQDLRRLANDGGDDGQIKDRLKSLQDLDARAQTDLQKAYEGVDSVLDLRQQAKFRLFEEQMERRKIELLMRARQANRQQKRNP